MKAALVVAGLVVAGVTGSGITLLIVGQPATVVRDVPGPVRTVTRTVRVTVRGRVRTVTHTVDVPGPAGIPCMEMPGRLVVFPGGGGYPPSAVPVTCSVAAVGPSANSEYEATAPNGQTATFTVGP